MQYIDKNQLLIIIGKYLVLKYYLETYYPKFHKVRTKLINVLNKFLIIYYRLQFNIELSAADMIKKKELETVNKIYDNYYNEEITDNTFLEMFSINIDKYIEYDKAIELIIINKATDTTETILIKYNDVIYS